MFQTVNPQRPNFAHSRTQRKEQTWVMKHAQPLSVFVEDLLERLKSVRKREKGASKIDPTVHADSFGRPASGRSRK